MAGLSLTMGLTGELRAAPPFYTDDPAVTAVGVFHVEAFDEIDALQSAQFPDLRQNTANFKFNVGLPHGLEFDVDVPYLIIDRSTPAHDARGVGDTNLGMKWFVHEAAPNSHDVSFAASFYLEFPTGNARDNLGSGERDYWLNLIAQEAMSDRDRVTVNLGVLFAGNTSTGVVGIETTRGHVYTGGLSVEHDLNDKLSIGAEIYGGISDNSGLDRTQLQAMLGASFTPRANWSIYLGLIGGTFTGSPRLGGQVGIAVDFPRPSTGVR